MRVSLAQIKKFIDFDLPPIDELVDRINKQLGGVEEIIDLDNKYREIIVVKVVEAVPHPNADRLRICKVDDDGVASEVPRDENGYIQVVCGAPNAESGMYAAWLPPGSTVPATSGDAEPFVLSARELRGVLSQGMLAATDELGFDNNHETIIEIKPDEKLPYGGEIKAGASFSKLFGLDDYAIDIENKMFTHRPDLFGQLGVAREVAGIIGQKFTSPKWYSQFPEFTTVDHGLKLEVFNDAPDQVSRFMAVSIKDVEVKPSPLWLQCALVAMGSKPINNIVDITNYIMLLTAQPTHAYDYDKIRGARLGARMAHDGEKITLLNNKTYDLAADDIVITDSEGAIGLGGVMGGKDSEVSADTKNIVLEVANFDMYTVRKSAMRHGVFTDALTRFNKGQSPFQNEYVMSMLMDSIYEVAGGDQASDVYDVGDYNDGCIFGLTDSGDMMHALSPHGITRTFINERLGLHLSDDEIKQLLENVEFKVEADDKGLKIYGPFWRTDIIDPEDIVEEVGRLYGFDKLPRELPTRSMRPTAVHHNRLVKQAVRDSLTGSGANEVLTYSFVHENIIKRSEQTVEKAFRLGNALSPDLQYYRLSVLPSLLDKVHMNIKAGHDEFVLYEIGKAHHKDEYDDEGLPCESERIAGVYACKTPSEGAPYYQVKRIFEQTLSDLGGAISPLVYQKINEFDFGESDALRQMAAPFDPERSSLILHGEGFAGIIGEFKQSVTRNFKLPECAAGFELYVSPLEDHYKYNLGRGAYWPLSKFPKVTRDISLRVDSDVKYIKLYDIVHSAVFEYRFKGGIYADIEPISIYQPDGTSTKTITFRVSATSHERTLRDEDIKPLLEHAAGKALEAVGATLV